MKRLRQVLRAFRQGRRMMGAPQGFPWLRFGYMQALQDMRSGAIELGADPATMQARVNEVMNDWIEDGS